MAHSPCFSSPLAASFLPSLSVPLLLPIRPRSLTWNPPSCDRIRPPRSQVACRLTPFDPPSPQPSPFQIPCTPNTPRLTKTTSGTTRHLLSGTLAIFVRKGKLASVQCGLQKNSNGPLKIKSIQFDKRSVKNQEYTIL
jgi:hypothetical protein